MTCLSKPLGEPSNWCRRPGPWSPNICRCTLASDPAPGRSLVITTTRYCVPVGASPRSSSLQMLLQCSQARRDNSSRPRFQWSVRHGPSQQYAPAAQPCKAYIRSSKYAYNVSGIILLSSFPKAVLHRIRAFEGGPGSTGAPTTGACSSSVSGTTRAKGKPCMEAEANKKMQTLHSQLKKRHFMTARAQEAVACLVTAEHYKTCCLHRITEPQSDLKCSRTANLSCTPTHPSSSSMESHRPQ